METISIAKVGANRLSEQLPVIVRLWTVVLLALATFFPLGVEAQSTPERVTIGYAATAMSQFPIFVAQEMGMFRDEGIEAQLVRITGNVAVAALLGGDLGYTGNAPTTIGAALKGLPVKIVAVFGIKPSVSLVVRPEIRTVQDLKGKAIAVSTRGSLTDFFARQIVSHYGLNPDRDITTLGFGDQPQRLAAMDAKTAAGAIVSPPNDLKAEAAGFKILVFAGDFMEETVEGALGTSERRIRERRDQVKKVVRAIVRAQQYIRQQPEPIKAFAMRFWKLNRQQAEKMYSFILKTTSPDGGASEGAIQVALQQVRTSLRIDRELNVAQSFDMSILREVQRELGLAK